MSSIATTIPIDISKTPGVVENVFIKAYCSPKNIQTYTELFKELCDVFSWSYEEMSGIDPQIIENEIMTYPDAKRFWQNIRLVNPRKVVAIKAEVEKLLKASFIYPVQFTEWVSNPVPVNKKQGTIRLCMDFHDLNQACTKDNLPNMFINYIVNECAGCEVFSFMHGFSGYDHIQIKPEDQNKTTFIYHWGIFVYRKIPFGLKNVGATFKQAMSFSFHDLRHIVEAYLDDLESCSRKRSDYPAHLRLIF